MRFVPSISLLLFAFTFIAHQFFINMLWFCGCVVYMCFLIAPESLPHSKASRPNKVQASGVAEEEEGPYIRTHTQVPNLVHGRCLQAFMEAEGKGSTVTRPRTRRGGRSLSVRVYMIMGADLALCKK